MIQIQVRHVGPGISDGWFACRIRRIEGTLTPTYDIEIVNEQDISTILMEGEEDTLELAS
jgi:hypothetical protein